MTNISNGGGGQQALALVGTPKHYIDDQLNKSHSTMRVPAGVQWSNISVRVEYNADNAAGTRQIALQFLSRDDDIVMEVRPGLTQIADADRIYQFGAGLADITSFRDTDWGSTPIPAGFVLPEGFAVKVLAVAGGATADDIVMHVMVTETSVAVEAATGKGVGIISPGAEQLGIGSTAPMIGHMINPGTLDLNISTSAPVDSGQVNIDGNPGTEQLVISSAAPAVLNA